MKDSFFIDMSRICNTVEPKQFHKFEDGKMISYCYSVERDKSGIEVSRTKPIRLGSIGWDDGAPFTEDDHFRVKNSLPGKTKKRGFFSRLFSR